MHAEKAAITAVIPYFNEAQYLPATLQSLSTQRLRPFALVLVDNGSTDGSREIAARWAADNPDIATTLLSEERPGQVHALASGIAAVETPFLAIMDADTIYPPHYLELAVRLLTASDVHVVGFIAHDAPADPAAGSARARRWIYTHIIPRILTRQAHGGGYAHVMKTAPFRAAGGYSANLWPYVLKDHELVNRLWHRGRIAAHVDLWCQPSPRRGDRSAVRWTLFERIVYHLSPPATKDWFWYSFLKSRFEARKLKDTVLRQRPWAEGGKPPSSP